MILVCEDDKTLRETLVELLKANGFEAEWCRSEKCCRKRFAEGQTPDVIILDVMMPIQAMTEEELASFSSAEVRKYEDSSNAGLRLLRDLRGGKYSQLSRIPIIVYSILDKEEYKTEASRYGVPYFVKGDHKMEDVVAKVQQLVKRGK